MALLLVALRARAGPFINVHWFFEALEFFIASRAHFTKRWPVVIHASPALLIKIVVHDDLLGTRFVEQACCQVYVLSVDVVHSFNKRDGVGVFAKSHCDPQFASWIDRFSNG